MDIGRGWTDRGGIEREELFLTFGQNAGFIKLAILWGSRAEDCSLNIQHPFTYSPRLPRSASRRTFLTMSTKFWNVGEIAYYRSAGPGRLGNGSRLWTGRIRGEKGTRKY